MSTLSTKNDHSLSPLAENAQPFLQSATVTYLTDLLIELSSVAPTSEQSPRAEKLVEAIRHDDGLLSDQLLNQWLCACSASATSPARVLRYDLPRALLDGTLALAPEHAEAERLKQLAVMALRLATLEDRFAEELAAAKQTAIYNFAYGLSHELNNPLASIATRAGVLKQEVDSPRQRKLLQAIIDNAMRGHDMLGDLMLVAKPPRLCFTPVDLARLIDHIAVRANDWAQRFDVSITCFPVEARDVRVDEASFKECLWALIRNAIEVSRPGQTIQIACRFEREMAAIEVRDEAGGLSIEALRNGFDPYYSGREAGRGLGLGLSKAQRIVSMHRGELELTNNTLGGCSAIVRIPLTSTSA